MTTWNDKRNMAFEVAVKFGPISPYVPGGNRPLTKHGSMGSVNAMIREEHRDPRSSAVVFRRYCGTKGASK
jgi:hypothetical protein